MARDLTAKLKIEGAPAAKRDLSDVAKAADALGDALGPDLKAKIGQANLEGFVQSLGDAGATMQEVEANAQGLAGKLTEFDAAGGSLDGVRAKTDEVSQGFGKAGDASRSFAGNIVGDAAQAATGMGPLGQAIGQVTEGLLGGEVGFKQLLGGAAGIGAVAIGVQVLSGLMHDTGEEIRKAFNTKQIEEFTGALRGANKATDDVRTRSQVFADQLRDAGKIEAAPEFANGIKDLIPALYRAGVTVDDLAKRVTSGNLDWYRWNEQLKKTGVSVKDADLITTGAAAMQKNYETALQRSSIESKVFASTTKDVTQAMKDADEASDAHKMRLIEVEGASKDAAKAQAELRKATRELGETFDMTNAAQKAYGEGLHGIVDPVTSLNDASDGWRASIVEVTKELKKNGVTLDYHTKAGRANRDIIDSQVQAALSLATAQLNAGASTDEAATSVLTMRDSLIQQGIEAGFTRKQIEEYIDGLGLTPENVETQIKLSGQAAAKAFLDTLNVDLSVFENDGNARTAYVEAVAQGDYQTAMAILQTFLGIPVTGIKRTVQLQVVTAAQQIAYAAATGDTKTYNDLVAKYGTGYASGTDSATPGLHPVGEHGMELVNFRGGEQVIPHGKSMSLLNGSGGGGVTIIVQANALLGSRVEVSRWLADGIAAAKRQGYL